MKISFNIQYQSPARAVAKNDFERSFDEAVKARKNLALAATESALKGLPAESRSDITKVKALVRASLGEAGLPETQVNKVLTFVPFALATNLKQPKGWI